MSSRVRWRIVLLFVALIVFFLSGMVSEVHALAMSVNPSSQTTAPGGTVAYSISVYYELPTDALYPSVNLLVSPPLPGFTVSFSANNKPPPFPSTMSVHVDTSVALGSYTLHLWANPAGVGFPGPGNIERDVTLFVGTSGGFPPGGFDFSLTLSPSTLTVVRGEIVHYNILISYSDPAYSGTSIAVQVSGLGPGMDYQVIPSPPTLNILTSPSTPAGTYTITLTGSAKGVVHQTSVTLIVRPAMPRYVVDWALSNPSLSPSSLKVGDLTTFDIVVTQLSSNWTGWLTVYVNVKLDGDTFDTVYTYNNQPGPIPVGVTRTVSTKPWTATAGAHLVTWQLIFYGGDETVIITDPFPNNNQASLQFSVSSATSTQTATTSTSPRTIIQTVTQTLTGSAPFLTLQQNDLLTIGLVGVVLILIAALVLRRPRHRPQQAAATSPTPAKTAAGFCVNCGTAFPEDAEFCPKCGQRKISQ